MFKEKNDEGSFLYFTFLIYNNARLNSTMAQKPHMNNR